MHSHSPAPAPYAYLFGAFRLIPSQRLLERQGAAVHLGARALDILMTLIAKAGEVVGKRELFAQVWPNIAVDEVSLRVRMTELRRVLNGGDTATRYITTVQGQGYCFVAKVSLERKSAVAEGQQPSSLRHRSLPATLSRIIGRDETIERISEQVLSHRLVSILGPGGIGKSTVAISTANRLRESFADGVYFVDLGLIVDARLVGSIIATVLGLAVETEEPLLGIVNYLREKQILLVLDCCEHVIDEVAAVVEEIISATVNLHILATSRESLLVGGEHIHRLLPLGVPPESNNLSAAQAMSFPAVQLLVEKISASRDKFELSDADAPVAVAICRRLDGIALAIELAAGHVGAFGLAGTASGLDSQFGTIMNQRRFALPRHQTIFATLDWSYNLLSESERSVARALSTFVGPFTLEAVQAVALLPSRSNADIQAALSGLCSKSIVSADIGSMTTYYRLLDTTRSYLSNKLFEREEAAEVARRHAYFYREILRSARADAPTFHDAQWFDTLIQQIGNIRAALEWTFSTEGDTASAIALATSSSSILIDMSLLTECLHWTSRALALLDGTNAEACDELELRVAFGISMMYTKGGTEEAKLALTRGYALAQAANDRFYQLRLLSAFFKFHVMTGDLNGALAIAQKNEFLANEVDDPVVKVMVNAMLGLAYHLIGNHRSARRHSELAMMPISPRTQVAPPVRFDFDYRNAALCALARTSWLTGYPDKAASLAEQALAWASTLENPVIFCISLVWTISVYSLIGDMEKARSLNEKLASHARDFSLAPYSALSLGFKGDMLIKQGRTTEGIEAIQISLQRLKLIKYKLYTSDLARNLAEALIEAGRYYEALDVVDRAIEEVHIKGDMFILAELYRVKSEVLLVLPNTSAEAEDFLHQSLAISQENGTISWELRASITLARLRMDQNRSREAQQVLNAAYEKFTEGFTSQDLQVARTLLEHLDQPAEASVR